MSCFHHLAIANAWSSMQRPPINLGTAMVILGSAALVGLILMDRLTTFDISMAMLAAGLLQVSQSIAAYRRGWSAFAVLASLLYLAAAVAVLFQPLLRAEWTRLLIVGSLGCSGLSRIRASVSLASGPARWELLSGVTTVAVALLIYAALPSFSLWPIASIVALDIIVEGGALANAGYEMARDQGRRRRSQDEGARP